MELCNIVVLMDKSVEFRRAKYRIDSFERYLDEILSKHRVAYQIRNSLDDALLLSPDILVAGIMEESLSESSKILAYVQGGGVVVSYGGLQSLARELGYAEKRKIITGYAKFPEYEQPLRFFSASPWSKVSNQTEKTYDKYGSLHAVSPNGDYSGDLLLSISEGRGFIERWAVEIPGTIVTLQQGSGPVWGDGVDSPDGTIMIQDDILKADDRCAMDWEYDRLTTETNQCYYAYPYADWWSDIIVGHLIRIALRLGKNIAFLDYWPVGIPAVAAISHDSDLNVDEHASTTLEVLEKLGVRTTWCMMEPGYSEPFYEEMKQREHEIALHYNALELDNGFWDEEEFARQANWLRQAAGIHRISSNKNHYTRFEGWDELFKWCERSGIESDQTRGPSKQGNIGLLFGTCRPYFPISDVAEGNRLFNVLQIGFLSQDLNHPQLYDSSVINPFLDIVLEVEGVAHFLFHQAHIHNHQVVRDAMALVVEGAKERGYAFWTIDEINKWERTRRQAWVVGFDKDDRPLLKGAPLPHPVKIFVPLSQSNREDECDVEIRFGIKCKTYIVGEGGK